MAEPAITIRAYHDSGGGNLTPTRVVIHATSGGTGFPAESDAGSARATARYFASASAGGSAHYIEDVAGEEHCVPDNVIAWHAPPNPRSIGIEICADSTYTRDQWLSPQVWPAVLRAAARTRELCDRYGIPRVKLSIADLQAGRGGICGHVDVSKAFGESTHWDPGPGFPWDKFMEAVGGSAVAPSGPAPAPTNAPPRLAWPFRADHYVGDRLGPDASHGGWFVAERGFIKNVQQWLIYKGVVPGVPASSWATSGWADGLFDKPYSTDAAIEWHRRYYPNQPYPDQIWSDDYDRLARP
ncbi:N-acetylmuramoyl-L-alanine amidase [Lentzea sp. JNUCC 0626]|uniref:N-acetylmuramoyl-L-alanine amidase n=1 Tax=Lentzea sp. JNUCC 0626 TaxID=3367513 RepID=UPI0037485414